LENVSDSIVYPGVSQQIFYPRSEEAKTQIKQNQKINKFIIYVGSRARDLNYKNCNLLFEMLATTETFDFGLVFIGGEELTLEEREILQKYEFRHLFPTDEELAALISAADCLVSTSLYEGFGMPVLEALACGTPVIATNTSSLPEAHGDLALTISGSNSHELYDAILASTGEEIRKEISHAGPEHASNFNWMNSARILVNEIANSIIDNEPKNRNWLRLVESYELLMLLSQY
jgi:glycosyltransferase involved in cell wall biosynthesis